MELFFTMTTVNAELVLNAVTEKLRNVPAALEKQEQVQSLKMCSHLFLSSTTLRQQPDLS